MFTRKFNASDVIYFGSRILKKANKLHCCHSKRVNSCLSVLIRVSFLGKGSVVKMKLASNSRTKKEFLTTKNVINVNAKMHRGQFIKDKGNF